MVALLRLLLAVVAVMTATTAPLRAEPEVARVDVALVLAVDVSGSVNRERFKLQVEGYAAAFRHPAVIEAITSGLEKSIAVTLVQWAGVGDQDQVISWRVIRDAETARAFASAVAEMPRLFSSSTAVGSALSFCQRLHEKSRIEARRRIIDISGDGVSNSGWPPAKARDAAVAEGLTINGLPILADEPHLDHYYRENVIGGPGAFVTVARDFSDFPGAILEKLVSEIAGMPTGPILAP
jgi:hypothetical protein